jgi:RNA polymerase sigma-70 factor (ECF subfamily)
LEGALLNREALFSDYMSDEHSSDVERVSDWALIQQIAARDEDAFSELYARYSTAIYTYLIHMIYDRVVAEDLLQDVFISVWKAAGGFRGQSSVKTWIYRIAHHQTVSWLRKHRRAVEQSLSEMRGQAGDPEAIFEQGAKRKALSEALSKLSMDHREVIELAFYHELSYREIADVLKCPVGTVKSRMSYAKRQITRFLDQSDIVERYEKKDRPS